MNDNQIARLDEDNVKTEPALVETISESEPHFQNTDEGPSHQDEASAATSSAEHQQPEPYRQTCVKTEGGCDGFFIKVSKNKLALS